MRIIGGYDYYDSAGMGFDPTLTFVRHKNPEDGLITEDKDHPFLIADPVGDNGPRYRSTNTFYFCRLMIGAVWVPFVMFFSEKKYAYEGRVEQNYHPTYGWGEMQFLYDKDEAMEKLITILGKDAHKRSYFAKRTPAQRLEYHFRSYEPTQEQTDWLLTNKVATLIHIRRERKTEIYINTATLKDVHAWKGIDPATAHMRLSEWVGGVLSNNPDVLTISDKDKARKAGFDNWSFKTRPK